MTDVKSKVTSRERFTRFPVSSFSPSLLDILLKGSRERVEIPCPDQRTMQHIQARLHALRAAMRRENHDQYKVVTRARTSRTWERGRPDSNCVLVIQPHDVQFDPLFKAAGIQPTEAVKDLLDDIKPPPPKPPEPVVPSSNPYDRFKDKDDQPQ